MKYLTPGDGPYAVSAYILHTSGHVLAVSRKHDQNDFGFPGGKLDPGESFVDALIREVKEETGLDVIKYMPVFGDYCGTPGIHHVHWCLTFICKVKGEINTSEKGRVMWVSPERLIQDGNGKSQSFGSYNACAMQEIANVTDPVEFVNTIPLVYSRVLSFVEANLV